MGIGIPGSVDPATGLAKGASSTWLNGKPVEADLRRALGREVRIANDADCFAVSEAVDGAGAGHNVVFAVILGSGAGAGVAVGKAHHGPNNSAGEWGTIRSRDQMSLRSLVPPAIAADTDASSDGLRLVLCPRLPPARQHRHGPPSRRPQSRSWPNAGRRATCQAGVESVRRSRGPGTVRGDQHSRSRHLGARRWHGECRRAL